MAHWGWYWKVKLKHTPRVSCTDQNLCTIDSYEMFNKYQQVEIIRATSDRCSFYIPGYKLKAFLQDDDSLLVKYYKGSYVIPVERQQLTYGGYRFYFHCPLCDKRMRKLYCLKGQYQCRDCGNLAYFTQRLRPAIRNAYMSEKLKKSVKHQGGDLESKEKPPRMHKITFEQKLSREDYLNAKYSLATNKEIRDWKSPKIAKYIDEYIEYENEQTVKAYEAKRKHTADLSANL